ncbi:uncharacterized protein LOC124157924 [Ischnura elegans]|uniref:uncharacterized protein LOC124157924 n=1 Tax=Ischnura elegans TaxID=197161 RepID=UPI001ED8A265|nr:uncharacterized protein LOC124157924 [Ischnura elegans]
MTLVRFIMEESAIDNRRQYLMNKIGSLRADIEALESDLANGDKKFLHDFLPIEPTPLNNGGKICMEEKRLPAKLSKLLELSAKANGFQLVSFSRKLRFNPGGLFQYDCFIEGRTPVLKFLVKFIESVQGPGCECGEISSLESEVTMLKKDPESLTDWIIECCHAGDLAMLVHGLVEFTQLANNRRNILRSLLRRGKSGHLGSCHFTIDEEDGVVVVGVGPKNVKLFSIKWKIVYFPPMKSMKSTFTITLHEEDLQYESAEVFAALQRPYMTEEDLPLLWDTVADVLISYC